MSRIPPETMPMPDEDFPIKLVECRFDSNFGSLFPLHWHPHWELIEVRSGNLKIRIGEEDLIFMSGDVAVIGGGAWHAGESFGKGEIRFRTLIFHPELLRSAHQDSCESAYVLPLVRGSVEFRPIIHSDQDLLTAIEGLAQELHQRDFGYQPEVKGLLFRTISLLFRRYKQKELNEVQIRSRMLNSDRLQKVFERMEADGTGELSVADLAAEAGMSPSHFSRTFAEITGKPPLKYFNLQRLEKAEAFLAQGRGTVTEAALSVGFSDLNYFSRLFRRFRGRPPSQVLSERKTHFPPIETGTVTLRGETYPIRTTGGECLIW